MEEIIKPIDFDNNKPTYNRIKQNYINSIVLSRFYIRDGEYLISNSIMNLAEYLVQNNTITQQGLDYTIAKGIKEIETKYPRNKRTKSDIDDYISKITPSLKKK